MFVSCIACLAYRRFSGYDTEMLMFIIVIYAIYVMSLHDFDECCHVSCTSFYDSVLLIYGFGVLMCLCKVQYSCFWCILYSFCLLVHIF